MLPRFVLLHFVLTAAGLAAYAQIGLPGQYPRRTIPGRTIPGRQSAGRAVPDQRSQKRSE